MSVIDVIWKLIRYNLKIVFGNKFVYFLSAAIIFFLLFTGINIFEDQSPSEETVYYLLLFPGILLVFYPATFGIQNDEDTRILEILFGIPNYRFKVWGVRLLLMYLITAVMLFFLSYFETLAVYPTNVPEMVFQLMFPVFFLGCFSFMVSTMVRSGNGTAVVMIVVGMVFWISAGILEESPWNIFLNPFSQPPNDMNEVLWEGILFRNRAYLTAGTVMTLLYGLMNLQKREKFV
ncbi:MAG: hypothetical protein OEX02_13960 [Cyclobacteriaceae bacterium]|nr:hypothetical protein [Cyclobacteriaceae bacterium]